MYFLIGHRGVGKTNLVKNLEDGFDLDEEISKEHDIEELLTKGFEIKFREIEHKTLSKLLKTQNPLLISLGAGFELEKFDFPKTAVFIWVQRQSDQVGRVFLDRPRLDSEKNQIKEFLDRKRSRDDLYKKKANFTLEFEEGTDSVEIFKKFLNKNFAEYEHGFYTLNKKTEFDFLSGKVELRTDFFTEKEIEFFLKKKCLNKTIVALRRKPSDNFLKILSKNTSILVDLPIEYVKEKYLNSFNKENIFVSEHSLISLKEIKEINKKGFHLKWAPEVKSLEDLIEHHEVVKDMDVSFLPRSVDGRWSWYRQLTFYKNKITFYRYGLNECLDQPCYYELNTLRKDLNISGAVLGDDVSLSYSPSYHRKFFKEYFRGTYVKICLYQDEFSVENLEFLRSLGLKCFSVSSPFKNKLGELVESDEGLNTLFLGKTMKTLNTDSVAILFLKEQLAPCKRVLVWGAGVVGKAILAKIGKKAYLQGVRAYEPGSLLNEVFDALVWSAGLNCVISPELKESPKIIFDVEYKDHSQAKTVALLWGSDYISGKEFFEIQAKAQQKFWSECSVERL